MEYGFIVIVVIGIFLFFKWVNILKEYERAVTFVLGRLTSQPKGPGLVLIFWPFETMIKVSLQTVVLDVPPQDVITRDNVSVKVNAVVYFRVVDPRGRSSRCRTTSTPRASSPRRRCAPCSARPSWTTCSPSATS